MPFVSKDEYTAYFQIFLVSVVFFFCNYYFYDMVLSKILNLKVYNEMSSTDKADFLSRVTAQIHALISSYWAYLVIFRQCESGLPLYAD